MPFSFRRKSTARFFRRLASAVAVMAMTSCVPALSPEETAETDRMAVQKITAQLVALPGAGERTRKDAGKISRVAVTASREQAARYNVAVTGWWHNMMVNTRLRQRGLCWQWMEDLYPRLRTLDTPSFQIVCGVRDPRTPREHHCVVAIPSGRPFEDGLVLDPWVEGGKLKAFPVRGASRKWHYDPLWTAPLEERLSGQRHTTR